jgi:hypothetical protein
MEAVSVPAEGRHGRKMPSGGPSSDRDETGIDTVIGRGGAHPRYGPQHIVKMIRVGSARTEPVPDVEHHPAALGEVT